MNKYMYVFSLSKNEICGPNKSHVYSSLYSVKISLRILDPPETAFVFQSSTEKTVLVILIYTDTIIKQYQIPI